MLSRRRRFVSNELPDKLTNTILVRTPYWEVELDGRFSDLQRRKILEHLFAKIPTEEIEETVVDIEDDDVRRALRAVTRRVVRRTYGREESM
jgi:hypothetical protein